MRQKLTPLLYSTRCQPSPTEFAGFVNNRKKYGFGVLISNSTNEKINGHIKFFNVVIDLYN